MDLLTRIQEKSLEYTLQVSAPILPLLADSGNAYAQQAVGQADREIPFLTLATTGLLVVAAERARQRGSKAGIYFYMAAGASLAAAAAKYYGW